MDTKKLFNRKSLNYKVELSNGKKVEYVNLDNAATTTPLLNVEEGVIQELQEYGSVHRGAGIKSQISTKKFEDTRETIKKFVNARKEDYAVFVPNTTVGMNQLAYFFANIKGKIMVSDIEHSSSFLPWIFQEGRHQNSFQVSLNDALKNNTNGLNNKIMNLGRKKVITYKTKEDFTFDLASVEKIFSEQDKKGEDEKIKVLVVTGASNVTGYKPPIKELAKIAHNYGALIVVDACQLLQHEKIDMIKQDVDFVVFSGHKMYAPFGSGAIVGNKNILDAFWPYQMGGGNFPYITSKGEVLRYKNVQAHDPGTPNFVGARSLYYSIKELDKIGVDKISTYEHSLVEKAYSELGKIKEVVLYVKRNKRGVMDTSLITFNIKHFPCLLVAEILNDEYGIGTRAGSYCVYEFSRRILNIKSDKEIIKAVKEGKTCLIPGSVRASFSLVNKEDDIERLVRAISEIAKKGVKYYLKKYSHNNITGEYRRKYYGNN
ncbi:aminotransferase class V-fold PLP-dependent enzyme [Candidatus Woesearchaeota archaeon]|jgi:cysteine desulfurase / selenocysteine lyase|nr:aminotransferase class V-fold PLP-dependent enzyme [Candidatus Woesearchaeota archaeon]MBT4835164.1 aminotransferase class V-fold PLP-dependent enzyme [Candidatus Woesearchaeota archaeon]MBT6735243.1 aminotransferase class V-fold PLP-dependent enzyme [Candidatus Woesearchaeota archaeon]MBT7169536.1 aminotransferase class V-fold PLP-dependent enzyme [Candidatus Woesearchaeota archaeon]MBT7474652.1 aminotransferase class V-fold PLP-dependent enzyme [Candidatus Woesearchaeota archaeon]